MTTVMKVYVVPILLVLVSLFMILNTLAEEEHANKEIYAMLTGFLFVLLLVSLKL